MSRDKAAAHKIKHANVPLKIDAEGPNWSDEQAANAVSCSVRTAFSVRQRCVELGLEAALERKKRECPPSAPLLDGEKEARLVQIACSEPPQGAGSAWRRPLTPSLRPGLPSSAGFRPGSWSSRSPPSSCSSPRSRATRL